MRFSSGLRIALVVLSLFGARPALGSPSFNPEQSLQLGREAYARHDYGDVVAQVFPLLHPTIELGTEDNIAEAHKLLALSFFRQKQPVEARREVLALYVLRPNFRLDAFVEAPDAVRFFENIRKEENQRLEEILERQRLEEERLRAEEEKKKAEARKKAERVFVERTVERHSRLIAMIPFGVGQIQNGDRGLAILFGTTEATLGLLSLASWISIQQLFPGAVFHTDADAQLAKTLTGLQLGSGIAFWAMVAAGIIDAQVKLKREVVVKSRELPGAPKKHSWNLSPILSPTQFGIGVQGAF